MPAKIHSLSVLWMECETIEVELDIMWWLPKFTVVWLGDTAVQESRERVRSAVKNTDPWYRFPTTKITANLAPADIRKNGVIFDLPIALWVLIASHQLVPEINIDKILFVWELALNWKLRHINGVLPMIIHAKEQWFEKIVIPAINAKEASLIEWVEIIAVENLEEVVAFLNQEIILTPIKTFDFNSIDQTRNSTFDFSQIKWQAQVKRVMEISAAGGHNLLMNWSPWSWKTLMARTYPTILPKMTLNEALDVTKIYSIANKLPKGDSLIKRRPFRSVHHTASAISIIWWWRIPMPGEISLANKWVLFMDEMPEFPTNVLEVLRQPLEDKKINVTRVNWTSEFPADFTLIAAMNPCPCGYYNVPNADKECTCSASTVQKYQKKISWPLLDRIDLYVDVSPVKFDKLINKQDEEPSETIRKRVQKAKNLQNDRFKNTYISSNSEMNNKEIKQHCFISEDSKNLLQIAVKQMNLSARWYYRVLKIARTIADLFWENQIRTEHIAEALQYRKKVD